MFHTPPPHAAPQLAGSFSALLLAIPKSLFIPFTRAFWSTHAILYPTLDGHRLDKFLLVMRSYVGAGMEYLCVQGWKEKSMTAWLEAMQEEGVGPLSVGMGKEGVEGEVVVVGDGVRYHALDVWVDELCKVQGSEEGKGRIPREVLERLMEPVRTIAEKGRTKTVRRRAKEVLADERLRGWGQVKGVEEEEGVEEEWAGLD